MSEVEPVTLDATPTVAITRPSEMDRVGDDIGELLPMVAAYLERSGVEAAGAPYVRYHDFDGQRFVMEVGVPVGVPAEGDGSVEPCELPAGRAARTLHVGPYQGLPDAHARVHAWLREHGHEAPGAPWETYLNDPRTTAPDALRTEVVYPIQPVS